MITSFQRGHKIIFKNNKWVYADTFESITKERTCKKCGRFPKKGQDACLAHFPNVKAACCGHGINNGYIKYERKTRYCMFL